MAYGPPQALEADDAVAGATLQVAADIVQNQTSREIGTAPSKYQAALWSLYAAAIGRSNGKQLHGEERLSKLQDALTGLEPAIASYKMDPSQQEWLDNEVLSYTTELRDAARYVEASDRVTNSVRIGKDKVIELPDSNHPREQGTVLHAEIPRLVGTIGIVNEQVIRAGHDGIHHQAEAMMEGKTQSESFGSSALVDLQSTLNLVNGFLTLTDQEFQDQLETLNGTGLFHKVATYSELVAAIVEIAGGAVAVTAAYSAALATAAGDAALASSAIGVARLAGLGFGTVISAIEIVHGLAELADPHATRQDKVDGAVGASSGLAWFIGKRSGGAAVGAAASTAIFLGYMEAKLAANAYWQTDLAVTAGLMRCAFTTIQVDGQDIATTADKLAKAGLLRADETDPEKAAALVKLEANLAAELGQLIDDFLDDCGPHGIDSDAAEYPGDYTILREEFVALAKYRGAKTPEAAATAATATLERITWCLTHANELVVASAKGEHLRDVEAEDREKKPLGEHE